MTTNVDSKTRSAESLPKLLASSRPNSPAAYQLTKSRWSVIDRNKTILASQRSALKRGASSFSTEELVKALSAIVGELSREIVKTLQTFEKQAKTLHPVA